MGWEERHGSTCWTLNRGQASWALGQSPVRLRPAGWDPQGAASAGTAGFAGDGVYVGDDDNDGNRVAALLRCDADRSLILFFSLS